MINVRNEIKLIVDSIRSTGTITTFVETDGIIAVKTNDVGNLEVGFKIILKYADSTKNRDAVVLSVNKLANTFTIAGTSIETPTTWEMALYYDYGHRAEIYQKYTKKENTSNKLIQEYPLIWLYTDFTIEDGDQEYIECITNLKGSICDFSKVEYYEDQRMLYKFVPIIHPIYELFQNAFKTGTTARKFSRYLPIKFNTTDRPFFGSADKNKPVLPQITDALEWEVELNWFEQSTCN